MKGKATYITPEEIAAELRVSVSVVSAWLRKGMIRGVKVGKYWRVRPEDYRSFIDAQTNIPTSQGSPRQHSQTSQSKSRSRTRRDAGKISEKDKQSRSGKKRSGS